MTKAKAKPVANGIGQVFPCLGFLNEVRRRRPLFYSLVIASTDRIHLDDGVVVAFIKQGVVMQQWQEHGDFLNEVARQCYGAASGVCGAWIH